jgi:hypothetical protein
LDTLLEPGGPPEGIPAGVERGAPVGGAYFLSPPLEDDGLVVGVALAALDEPPPSDPLSDDVLDELLSEEDAGDEGVVGVGAGEESPSVFPFLA